MLGWKTVTSIAENTGFAKAKRSILNQGFCLFDVIDENGIIFKKPGTTLTVKGKKIPQKLCIVKRGNNIELQLKYDTFVLIDTGDLEKELERIIRVMQLE